MKFNISPTLDLGAEHKLPIFTDFIQSLKLYFEGKDYGESVKEITIGCICAKVSEGFEKFYKIKKPTYVDSKVITNKFTGLPLTLDKVFLYDAKFDNQEYDEFISAPDEESKKILAMILLNSLDNLEKLPKSANKFDKEKFKSDMHTFLKSHYHIS
jgi:hypothetical protein